MKLYATSTIEAIKEKHRFQLSKSLGQNFITDKHVIERIVEGADPSEKDLVIEIGPGKTLSGFLKKIDRNAVVYSIQTMEDLEKTVELLKGRNL